uniref:Uncharacterized protein n=1 Tax=Fagus sylvatica TaxID=28930 RepID=A0A2N9GJY4_FAGSY
MEAEDTMNQPLSASERQMQALTANIQELARQSAADRREMQELAKQNQELMALLRSRGEIPSPVPHPSQVADPTKSIADAKAAKLEEELKEMREQMKEMKSQVKAKAARNLDMLVHRSESPFTKRVDEYPLPAKFKVPQLETFDGFKDPLDYLDSFRTVMRLQGVSDEIMCCIFPTNLRGSARTWFNQLEIGSIDTFAQLSRAFIDNFIGGRRSARPANYLLNIRQREGESLRSYVQRFNKEAVQIDEPNEYVALTAFNAGLRKGDFLFQLCKDPPKSMSELMYEAQKFINAEDAFEARDEFPSRKRKEPEDRRFDLSRNRFSKQDYPKIERKNVSSSNRREERPRDFTPLNMSIDQVLLQIQDNPEIRWPGKLRSDLARRSKDLYCRFHRDHGHTTEDCYALKQQIEALIRQGKLEKFVRQDKPETRHEPRPPRQDENKDRQEDRPRDIIGEIRTIVGGLASGGASRSSRKAYARQAHNILVTQKPRKNMKMDDQVISFSEDDARGELKGDQATARECYFASLGSETKHQTMKIDEGHRLVEPTEELEVIVLDDEKPHKTTSIGTKIDGRLRKSMIKFLKNNLDFFAWTHDDMPGIDPIAICHKLNLLTAGFIREMFYPDWLANVVMVKKANGKWRMCVDFTDLNKACPKDSFPLPRIDQLVDSTAGHRLLTFMDAFSGYNQIMMDEADQEKTSFITSKRLFCYKVMPFGLKNAGATYQRLMNKMFRSQIGRNVEVYIDDMLVKTKDEANHLEDLEETFKTFRQYRMKLNPSKCVFGVSSGKFLGFMVSQRGIEANPDKINAVLEMTPPRTVKEVQSLTGRVVALNRFVSRATDKCLPFFKTLRKAFTWTDKCQKSFEELKQYLTSPPLLSPSQQGETLSFILSGLPDSCQLSSHQGRQWHTVASILHQQSLPRSRRKISGDGKTGTSSCHHCQETATLLPAIKAQALADFIAEFTVAEEEPPEEEPGRSWEVKIDGSSVKGAGGVGVVFKTPEGHLLKHSVRLQYPTTNNEAEYEALLTSLHVAKELGATMLRIQSDSQLIVGQVNSEYEAKENRMTKYLELVKKAIKWFDEVTLVQVPLLTKPHGRRSEPHRHQQLMDDTNHQLPERGNPFIRPCRSQKAENPVHKICPNIRMTQSPILALATDARGFGNLIHSPPETLTPMTAPWPFAQWGLDIMGPLPVGRRQLKFFVVGIDYFTKWVEAEPLATIMEKNVRGFVWKTIICRFGIPKTFISDNGRQFDNSPFREFCEELGIHNHYSSLGHPQANGQVEVTNRSLLKMIKTRLEGAKGLWPEELPNILTNHYDESSNDSQLRANLDLLDEVRDQAEAKTRVYQQRMARYYDRRVKHREFKVGDLVLRKVTLVTKDPTQGKLGPTWEGPYRVIKFHRRGTYHLEKLDGIALPHPWNAEHLKKYYQ